MFTDWEGAKKHTQYRQEGTYLRKFVQEIVIGKMQNTKNFLNMIKYHILANCFISGVFCSFQNRATSWVANIPRQDDNSESQFNFSFIDNKVSCMLVCIHIGMICDQRYQIVIKEELKNMSGVFRIKLKILF